MSRASVRSTVRGLPPERRRDVLAALREGRRANDPRDAPIVARLAERPARVASRWPLRVWIQPARSRDRIERAVHAVGIPFALASVAYGLWSEGGWVRRAILVWLAVTLLSIPAYVRVYRVYRNAPGALAANQDTSP